MRLVTLGGLSLIRDDGSLVASALRKPLTMLAIVAANAPAGTPRDQLMLLLWPESSPDRARQALSQSMYALRQELAFAPITGNAVLTLDPRITSDLTAFREAVQRGDPDRARALAGGPFLAGVRVADSADFDQWLDRLQREIDDSLTSCLLSAARRASELGAGDTIPRWQQYSDRVLLDPPAVRETAQALAQGGNRAAALQLLARHAEAMTRDLGIGADAATVRLARTLRQTPEATPSTGVRIPLPAASPSLERATIVEGRVSTSTPRDTPKEPIPADGKARPRWRSFVLAAVSAAVLLVMWFATRGPHAAGETNSSRVLVAPFRYSGDSAHRYLSAGIAEEIAARLSTLEGLTLYPPSLVQGVSAAEPLVVARRLDAKYLLEGTVRTESRDGRLEVRVVSQLIDAADGHLIWTWSARRLLDGVLQLQLAIADSTARRVSMALSAASLGRLTTLPTKDPAAFDLYLRALQYLRDGRDGLPEAAVVLRRAVAIDSGFAEALARLGETQARMNWYGYDRDSLRMREALRLIERSRVLAPERSEPHLAMAQWLLADRRAYREASAELDTALMLANANVDALFTRANILRRTGRWTESAADYAEAARLDPSSYGVALEHGNTLLLIRRFAEARTALERAQALSPDAVDPVAWLAALAVRENGDTAAARRVLEDGLEHVNAHSLVARVAQTFPELMRVLPAHLFARVSETSLRNAFGDTALRLLTRAELARVPVERELALDSAALILNRRIEREPGAFAAYRTLSKVRMAQQRPADAVRAARNAIRQMPPSQDVYAAMQSLATLAEAEVAAGVMDSAAVHLRELLATPSVISPALVALDPAWGRFWSSPASNDGYFVKMRRK